MGKGNIGVHSYKDQQCICTQCHKTFTATKGTAFYCLRTSAETVTLVDIILVIRDDFDVQACDEESRQLFDHPRDPPTPGHAQAC